MSGPRVATDRSGADWFLASVVATAAVAVGSIYLFVCTGPIGIGYGVDPVWFETSVMVACGRGFTTADPAEVPGLADFLDQKQMVFAPSEVPADMHARQVTFPFYLCHRYLFMFMGYNWRLFGISWTTFKIPLVVSYALTALIVFGLCRLAMNRALSMLCTALYMMSPAVLVMLPSMRDFCKAPFILGVLLIMGLLLKNKVRPRTYLGASVLLGLVLGIGLGFRQDLLICIPPTLVVLFFCARGQQPIRLRRRVTAVALFLAVFLASAFPILQAMTLDAGAVSSHTLVQGFSKSATDALGLGGSSYEVLYSTNDNFVYATINSYARRMGCMESMYFHSPSYARAGKRFGFDVMKVFPGDMLARTYAAVPAVLGSVAAISTGTMDAAASNSAFLRTVVRLGSPLTDHLGRCALVYAFAVLTVLSLRGARAVWTVLLLCGYMFGYTSLLFQQRHCFHYSLVSFLMLGYLADRSIRAGAMFLHDETRRTLWRGLLTPRQWLGPVRRAVFFWLILCALLVPPLYAARAYQHRALDTLLDTYSALDLQPLETEATPLDKWVRFQPKRHFPFRPRPCDQLAWRESFKQWLREWTPSLADRLPERNWEVPAEYYVAEFSPDGTSFPIRIDYETGNVANDFSQALTVECTGASGPGPAKCFFPVYAAAAPDVQRPITSVSAGAGPAWVRARFAGLTMSDEQARRFRGLYRVVNVEKCPLFLFLSIPGDRQLFRAYKTLRQEGDAWHAYVDARYALDRNVDEAIAACGEAVDWFPQCPEFVPTLDALLVSAGDVNRRVAAWQRIADLHGGDGAIQDRYASALRAAGQTEKANDVMRRFGALPPEPPIQ